MSGYSLNVCVIRGKATKNISELKTNFLPGKNRKDIRFIREY